MPDRRHNRGSRPLRWLERLFLVAGAAALLWCAVIVIDGELAQWHAKSALEIAIAVEELTRAQAERQGQAHTSDLPSPRLPIDIGSVIAALSIPRVELSTMVVHGSDARTLQRGPGHLEHTALPGETGNIVIAGHRDSFFRPLRHITLGDDIFLDTHDGRFHYRVTALRVVGPREVDVLAPTSEEVLTLITCYPFWVLGHAPDRFIVRAVRVNVYASAKLVARSLPVRDWLQAPALQTTTARAHLPTPVPVTADDESLVREVVRRYLVAQGVRLATCGVTVSGGRATADCETAVRSPEPEQPGRMFSLERSTDAWTIRSIELRQRE